MRPVANRPAVDDCPGPFALFEAVKVATRRDLIDCGTVFDNTPPRLEVTLGEGALALHLDKNVGDEVLGTFKGRKHGQDPGDIAFGCPDKRAVIVCGARMKGLAQQVFIAAIEAAGKAVNDFGDLVLVRETGEAVSHGRALRTGALLFYVHAAAPTSDSSS